jgi:enoyl-CoA hydratase/carnithine racemase
MGGPVELLRAGTVESVRWRETLHEWREGRAALSLDLVESRGHVGAALVYTNPPVHQIGNPGLDAMLAALAALARVDVSFLLLTWPCDPVHAGGDLKESLVRLEATNVERARLEAAGAPREQVESLYGWADGRLDKGQALYRAFAGLAPRVQTVGVCGGGMRFGGSAEVNLMADLLVGDSRSGMCFSEAMIGLIPGWAGVARAATKAGTSNARWMAQTAAPVGAADLLRAGVYDIVVDIDRPLPKAKRTGDPDADRAAYDAELATHDRAVWPLLVARAAAAAIAPQDLRPTRASTTPRLATDDALRREVARRAAPETYRDLWNLPLRDVATALETLGRPLAPQSIAELDRLLAVAVRDEIDEDALVDAERLADSRLYRDPRLTTGIRATLEQRVADFREG